MKQSLSRLLSCPWLLLLIGLGILACILLPHLVSFQVERTARWWANCLMWLGGLAAMYAGLRSVGVGRVATFLLLLFGFLIVRYPMPLYPGQAPFSLAMPMIGAGILGMAYLQRGVRRCLAILLGVSLILLDIWLCVKGHTLQPMKYEAWKMPPKWLLNLGWHGVGFFPAGQGVWLTLALTVGMTLYLRQWRMISLTLATLTVVSALAIASHFPQEQYAMVSRIIFPMALMLLAILLRCFAPGISVLPKRVQGLFTLKWLILIGIGVAILYTWRLGAQIHPDTASYILDGRRIMNGHLAIFRTPLYPFLLQISGMEITPAIEFIMGRTLWLTIGQWAMYLLGTALMWRTLRRLGVSAPATWAILFTSLFLSHGAAVWQNRLCTESLSISFMMIMLWALVKGISERKRWMVAAGAAMSGLMFLLRPGSLIVPALLMFILIIWGWRKANIRLTMPGVWVCIAVLAGIGVYSQRISTLTGVFSPSKVTVDNDYLCARGAGWFEPQFLPPGLERDSMERRIRKYPMRDDYSLSYRDYAIVEQEFYYMEDRLGCDTLYDALRLSARENRTHKLQAEAMRFLRQGTVPIALYAQTWYAYLLILLTVVLLLRPKGIPGFRSLRGHGFAAGVCILLSSGQFLLTAMGAPNEYYRLNMSIYPCLLILTSLVWEARCYKSDTTI